MSQTSPDPRVPRPPRPPERRPNRPAEAQEQANPEPPLSENEVSPGTSNAGSQSLAPRPTLSRPMRPQPVAAPEASPSDDLANPELSDEVSSPDSSEETDENPAEGLQRQQPIPPPSEPMQYRAIGMIRGRYVASEEQFTRGELIASDGTPINAVLLGRVMSLVKNHLDLQREYLWVVYPRTRDKTNQLHAQILGVWEPVELGRADAPIDPGIEDGYFSIRGEIIFQSQDKGYVILKIRQAPRKGDKEKPKSFKLRLSGFLPSKGVGYFWSLDVLRDGENLLIQDGKSVAAMPPRKKRRLPPTTRKRAPIGHGGDGGLRRDSAVKAPQVPPRTGPVTKPIKRIDRPRREGNP